MAIFQQLSMLHLKERGLIFYKDFSTNICEEGIIECSLKYYKTDYRLYLFYYFPLFSQDHLLLREEPLKNHRRI